MSVEIQRTHNLEGLLETLRREGNTSVKVGVLNGVKTLDGQRYLAEVAQYLEYGWIQRVTPKQSHYFRLNHGILLKPGNLLTLPPRPFLRGTLAAEHGKWGFVGARAVMRLNSVTKALQLVGQMAVEDISATIEKGGTRLERFPRRAPMTMELLSQDLEKHPVKGKNIIPGGASATDRPLVRSSWLLKNISFELVRK